MWSDLIVLIISGGSDKTVGTEKVRLFKQSSHHGKDTGSRPTTRDIRIVCSTKLHAGERHGRTNLEKIPGTGWDW